ncbi:MAG: M12 family metallo-peptidase [Pseudomonadota bacterium]
MNWQTLLRTLLLIVAWLLSSTVTARAGGAVAYSLESQPHADIWRLQIVRGEVELALVLRPGDAVRDVTRAGGRDRGALHLVGDVESSAGSWARVSVDPNGRWLSGLVRTGDALFSVQTRRSGVVWMEQVATGQPRSVSVSRVLPLAAVVDSLYDEASDGQGRRRAIALINQVDGLFREQLGLALDLRAVRVIEDPTRDPLRQSGGTLEDVLMAFRNYRQSDTTLPDGVGLVHLFSGASLFDRRVGLAYTSGVCDPYGHDVSVSRLRMELITVAHELAHILGASHDSSWACGESNLLMAATVRSDLSLQMSACSVDAISPTLDRECFVQLGDPANPIADAAQTLEARPGLRSLEGAVPTEPVSPLVLLAIAFMAVGLIRRRH